MGAATARSALPGNSREDSPGKPPARAAAKDPAQLTDPAKLAGNRNGSRGGGDAAAPEAEAVQPAIPPAPATGPGGGPNRRPVLIDEPPEPRRIRRPADLLRVVFGIGFMLLIIGLGMIAEYTTKGVETDLSKNKTSLNQAIPLGFILAATSVALAVIPIALAVERLYRRDSRRVIDSVLAAAFAYLTAFGLNEWVGSSSTPSSLKNALTQPPAPPATPTRSTSIW